MSKNLYVDIHVLQTVPPSCVNRDDTGSPKTAVYGGVTRARVSSQAWKKAVRDHFRQTMAIEDVGVRTKRIAAMVAEHITSATDPIMSAEKILQAAGLQEKSTKAGKDAPLFFMSPKQAKALAELAIAGGYDKKQAAEALKSNPSIDIALFGRMVADEVKLNEDASCQVAHAISTHRAETEYDYFTAVDDNPDPDKSDAGAGHINVTEFNSSTLYRYATVAAHALNNQLGGTEATAEAVAGFADAFVTSMPTGKQNSFANRTLPDYVMIVLRKDQPVNLVGAFENAIRNTDNGFVQPSVDALEKKAAEVNSNWCEEPLLTLTVGADGNLRDVLNKLNAKVRELL